MSFKEIFKPTLLSLFDIIEVFVGAVVVYNVYNLFAPLIFDNPPIITSYRYTLLFIWVVYFIFNTHKSNQLQEVIKLKITDSIIRIFRCLIVLGISYLYIYLTQPGL